MKELTTHERMELIFRHDKQAFVIIENTLNVLGKGFSCVKEYK